MQHCSHVACGVLVVIAEEVDVGGVGYCSGLTEACYDNQGCI